MEITCPSCILGLYDECGHDERPPVSNVESAPVTPAVEHLILDTGGSQPALTETNEGRSLKWQKDNVSVKDAKSTGRKRAAELYPLDPESPCEWQKLANVGGGKYPIVGCMAGLQANRHHGPDKDTLNNSEGNVHRICVPCHNLWHAQNDSDYDPTRGHKPRIATNEELIKWNITKEYEKRWR